MYSSNLWQGWGKDNNPLCNNSQAAITQELLCEPTFPGGIDPNAQSWTGVVCTPTGYVLCLSLPGWGLKGNVSATTQLAPLQTMQLLNLAGNSLTGIVQLHVKTRTAIYVTVQTVIIHKVFCRCLATIICS